MLDVAGHLTLSGSLAALTLDAGTVDLAGTISNGTMTVNGGTLIDDGGLVAAKNFILNNGTLDLDGYKMVMGQETALSGVITGAGVLNLTGSALLENGLNIQGGATIADAGVVTQETGLNFGASATDSTALSIAGSGIYDLVNDSNIDAAGTVTLQDSGLLEKTAATGTSVINARLVETAGGTVAAVRGTLDFAAGGTIAGKMTGAGEIALTGGVFTIANGAAISAGIFAVDGADLAMGGAAQTLAGNVLLNGNGALTGPGTLALTGTADVNGFNLSGGAVLLDRGTISQDGGLALGQSNTDSGFLSIATHGAYILLNSRDIDTYGTAVITDAGLFEKTADTYASHINPVFDEASTGTIAALAGMIALQGGGTLSGTLTGAGAIALNGGAFTIGASAVISGLRDFQISGGASVQDAASETVKYVAGLYNGTLAGGKLNIAGTGDVNNFNVAGSAVLQDSGFLTQDDFLQLGETGTDTAILTIAAGGTYDLLTDSDIRGDGGVSVINAGLFEKTGSTGQNEIRAAIINAGTIDVQTGVIGFDAGGTLGGTLEGGRIDLDGGTFVLASTLAAAVATLAVTGGNIATGGRSISLADYVYLNGGLAGPGTLSLGAHADIAGFTVYDGATLLVKGTATQDNSLILGQAASDSASLSIAATGTYDIIDDSGGNGQNVIYGNGTSSFVDNGLFEKTGGVGGSDIDAAFKETSTGTVNAETGALVFQGGGLLAGAVRGDAIIVNGGVLTLAATASITSASLQLQGGDLALSGNNKYAKSFDMNGGTLALNGDTLTLSGPDYLGAMLSGGTVNVTGIADAQNLNLDNGATVNDAGTILQNGLVSLGDGGSDSDAINISAQAVYDIVTDDDMGGAAPDTITNAGIFEKTGGTGESGVAPVVVNTDTGTITAALGNLNVSGGLINDGLVTVAANATFTAGYVGGTGSIVLAAGAAASFGGAVGSGQTVALQGGDSEITIRDDNDFAGTITNFQGGEIIDVTDVYANGYSYSGAVLSLYFQPAGANQPSTLVGTLAITGLTSGDISLLDDLHGGTAIELGPNDVGNPNIGIETDTWQAGSGQWSTGTNWGTYAPNGIVIAAFGGGLSGDTVVVSGNTNSAYQLDSDPSCQITMDILSGSGLALSAGGQFYGTIDIAGNGVLQVQGGAINLEGGGTIAGVLTGDGGVDLAAGVFTLAASAAIEGYEFQVGGGDLLLESTRVITTGVDLLGGTISLLGHNLTLAGITGFVNPFGNGQDSNFRTIAGAGTLDMSGTAYLNSGAGLVLTDGAVLRDDGTIIQQNIALDLGASNTDTAFFTIGAKAVYEMLGGTAINADGTAAVQNSGLLETTEDHASNYNPDILIYAAFTNAATGTIDIGGALPDLGGNVLALFDGGNLAGTITGDGALSLASGVFSLAAGAVLNVASLAIGAGTQLLLEGNRTYAGDFVTTRYDGATISLDGHDLTLSGAADLNADLIDGPGTLAITKLALNDASGAVISGGAVLLDAGTIEAAANLALGISGTDSAVLSITTHGVYDVLTDNQVSADGNVAVVNAGLFEMTADNGESDVFASFINTGSGTLAVASGNLSLRGGGTLAGELTGAGELGLQSGLFMLASTATVTVGTLAVYAGAELELTGGEKTIGGDVIFGNATLAGNTTLAISQTGNVNALTLAGLTVLQDTGSICQSGLLQMGEGGPGTQAAGLAIGGAGTFDMVGDSGINAIGDAAIDNAGLFEKTADRGDSAIYASFTNTSTGIVDAVTGDIQLAGGGTLAGTLTGGREIDLAGGVFTLASSLKETAGMFGLVGGAVLSIATGSQTLSGAVYLNGGTVAGAGTLDLAGHVMLDNFNLTGTAMLLDSGEITQSDGQFNLGVSGGDADVLSISSAGIYDLLDNENIAGQGGAAVINAGLFERTGDSGSDNIFANFVNTGTIDAVNGELNFYGGTFAGKLTGDKINFNGGQYTLAPDIVVNAEDLIIGVGNASTIALDGGPITIGAAFVQLGGFAGNGGAAELEGPGTLNITGGADINVAGLAGGAVLNDEGNITQDGNFQIAGATLDIAAAGTYVLLTNFDGLNIAAQNGVINNAGLFEKAGDTGGANVDAGFSNVGTVAVASGALTFETVANAAAGTLTGGVWEIAPAAGPADLILLTGSAIATDAADIILSGGLSELFSGPQGTTALESSLNAIAASGTLQLSGGYDYVTGNAIKVSGDLLVEHGGTLAAKQIAILQTGTLEIAAGGTMASGGISFSGTGGALVIGSATMPKTEISGFAAGDRITLAGISYVSGASVTVKTAGVVSITDGAKTYNLNIAGAKVGETDFVFGPGAVLTKTAPQKMQFLKPSASAESDLPAIAPSLLAATDGPTGGASPANGITMASRPLFAHAALSLFSDPLHEHVLLNLLHN